MLTFTDALLIAAQAHDGVRDAGGVEYIKHPLNVAHILKKKGLSNQTQIAGLLHDVVEDTDYTFDELVRRGASEDLINALTLLTHVKDIEFIESKTKDFISAGLSHSFARVRAKEEEYFRYVRKLAANDIAREVKLADLEHNSDITRVPPKDLENVGTVEYIGRRMMKYAVARSILTGGRVGY